MPKRTSQAQEAIEEQLKHVEPGTERHTALLAARDFKASWVELGERLTVLRKKQSYTDWGFASFEAYCRRELRIKSETAAKLTRSFSFLKEHEPRALEQRQSRELPPLDVVDLLSQARERSSLSQKQLDNIREEVFTPEAPPSRNQVVRRIREVDPEAFRPQRKPAGSDPDGEVRKALLLAERLQTLLEVLPGISRDALTGVRAAAAELRERVPSARKRG